MDASGFVWRYRFNPRRVSSQSIQAGKDGGPIIAMQRLFCDAVFRLY